MSEHHHTETTDSPETVGTTRERQDLLHTLRTHRQLFKQTTAGMTDEQGNARSTVSALTLGGLIKHVAETEDGWARFATDGPAALASGWDDVDWSQGPSAEAIAAYEAGFSMQEGETLDALLAAYDEVAARTDALVASIDLDAEHPLPAAPWFEPGARWSSRRVFMHIVAETAQHAGHADIIRESIDGAKTMG